MRRPAAIGIRMACFPVIALRMGSALVLVGAAFVATAIALASESMGGSPEEWVATQKAPVQGAEFSSALVREVRRADLRAVRAMLEVRERAAIAAAGNGGPRRVGAAGEELGCPLHVAAKLNELAVARLLIEHGAFANLPDADGRIALHYVRSPEMVELLRGADAAPNWVDSEDLSPIGYVSHHFGRDDPAVVDALLAMGAQMSYRDAIRLGRFEATKRLFHYDPNLAVPTAALYDAIHAQSEELVRWLVFMGTEVEGQSPLMLMPFPGEVFANNLVAWAVYREEFDSAAFLLQSGAPMGDSWDSSGVWELENSIEGPDVVARAGALFDKAVEQNHAGLLEQLVRRSFNLNRARGDLLHRAAQLGHREVFAVLVAAGAKPDEETIQLLESTAIEHAEEAASGPSSTSDSASPQDPPAWSPRKRPLGAPLRAVSMHLVREFWAATLIAFGSETPIVQAMALSPNRVESLVAAGHSIHGRDSLGQTPLHLACDAPFPRSISLLLEAGADPNVRTDDGRLPLEILALEFKYPADLFAGTKALLDAGADPAKATMYGPFAADLLYSQLKDEPSKAAMQGLLAPHLPPWLWR